MKLVNRALPVAYRSSMFARCMRRQFTSESLTAAELKPKVCYYKVLGLSPDTTQDQLKKAFQKIVKKNHPDLNPNPEAAELYLAANQAYKLLSNRNTRSIYDQAQGYKDADWGEADETISATWSNQDNLLKVINSPKEAPVNSFMHVKMTEHLLKPNPEPALSKTQRINIYADKQSLNKGQPLEEADQPSVLLSEDGTKQDPTQLHEYFKYKYIKNPEVVTADPEAQLAFTKKTHDTTKERIYETRSEYQVFMAATPHIHFEKKSEEAKLQSPLMSALLDMKWLFGAGLLLAGLYHYLLNPAPKKYKSQSSHVSHGEGYKNKLAPI